MTPDLIALITPRPRLLTTRCRLGYVCCIPNTTGTLSSSCLSTTTRTSCETSSTAPRILSIILRLIPSFLTGSRIESFTFSCVFMIFGLVLSRFRLEPKLMRPATPRLMCKRAERQPPLMSNQMATTSPHGSPSHYSDSRVWGVLNKSAEYEPDAKTGDPEYHETPKKHPNHHALLQHRYLPIVDTARHRGQSGLNAH